MDRRGVWLTGMVVTGAALASLAASTSCASKVENDGGSGGTVTTTSSTQSGGGGSGAAGGGNGGSGGEAPACYQTPDTVFAIDRLYFGDSDWNGTQSANAWRQFGRNIDGLVTTNDLSAHCQLYAGAPVAAAADGNNGIDNSFGRNLVPILLGLNPAFASTINDAITAGSFTLLMRLQGLGAGVDQPSVPGLLYGGGTLGITPQFDGTDCWPVFDSTLAVPTDIDSSTLSFPDGAVVGNTWSSDTTIDINLTVPFPGNVNFPMSIHQAKLSFALDANHQGATLGIISGVLDVNEFIASMQAVAGSISLALCSGATWDGLSDQMKQAADIMVDGSQDPGQACNAISIGLGFTLRQDGLGAIVTEPPPTPNPCP